MFDINGKAKAYAKATKAQIAAQANVARLREELKVAESQLTSCNMDMARTKRELLEVASQE